MNNLNIVELIEQNPIAKLSDAYNNKLLIKIKETFTGFEQKLFVSSFYCYLNYDKNLDFVVLSHRHGDHTSGLQYVLEQNPKVQFYAPTEAGSFGNPISGASPLGKLISRKVDDVPQDLHYFDGKYEDKYKRKRTRK